jgi:hypothetical protein
MEIPLTPPIQPICISTPRKPRPWHRRIPETRTRERLGYRHLKKMNPNEAAEKQNKAPYRNMSAVIDSVGSNRFRPRQFAASFIHPFRLSFDSILSAFPYRRHPHNLQTLLGTIRSTKQEGESVGQGLGGARSKTGFRGRPQPQPRAWERCSRRLKSGSSGSSRWGMGCLRLRYWPLA